MFDLDGRVNLQDAGLEGEELPPEIQPLLEIIEVEVPGYFDYPLDVTTNLNNYSCDVFSDRGIVEYLGLEENVSLDDESRVIYGMTALKRELDNHETDSIHVYEVKSQDDDSYFLGSIAMSCGQGGMDHNWIGVFRTQDEFCDRVRQAGYVLASELDALPPEAILERWES